MKGQELCPNLLMMLLLLTLIIYQGEIIKSFNLSKHGCFFEIPNVSRDYDDGFLNTFVRCVIADGVCL